MATILPSIVPRPTVPTDGPSAQGFAAGLERDVPDERLGLSGEQ